MRRAKAFGIKLIVIGVIIFSVFGIFYNVSLGRLFWMSLLITGITFIGDMFVLPKINKQVANLTDFGLYFLLYWGLGSLFIEGTMPMIFPALAAALFSAISEYIFHSYLFEKVFRTKQMNQLSDQLQTEFAEETDTRSITEKRQTKRK